MSNHLRPDQITRCIVDQGTAAERQHLTICVLCRSQLDNFENSVSVFRSSIRHHIDEHLESRPFAVAAPVHPQPHTHSAWRWVLAASAVVMLVVGFFMSSTEPRPMIEQVSTDSDPDVLMRAVNLHLSRTLPAPMEPMIAVVPAGVSSPESGELR